MLLSNLSDDDDDDDDDMFQRNKFPEASTSVSPSLACKYGLLRNLIVIVITPGYLRLFSAEFLKASEKGSSCHMIKSDIITSTCFVFFSCRV